MAQKSLAKYVSREKIKNERGDYFLYQEESESQHQAWERHKELLRVCPYYGLPEWLQIQIFYNRLYTSTNKMVDALFGGILMKKPPKEAHELIEKIAANHY